ncbi:alpha/beta fold hydrolase [Kitasatospora sp. NPDC056783]|uniref:alpha/beta fold hydrolase n=1 Tax=Kitasatospora sp. NPDC056783 TaxID=3345943 RepID=UPI0036783FEF
MNDMKAMDATGAEEARYLDVRDGRIAYRLSGPQDGPLVVLVHGLGDSGSTYRMLAPALAAAGHRVANTDVRGYGRSGADWPSYGSAAVGGDVLALIRELGGPATVIGHSIGCAAAVWAAAEAPAEVAGLVLIGTFAGGSRPKAWMRAASWLVTRSPALWGLFYRSLFPVARPADFDRSVEDIKADLAGPGRMVALRAQLREILGGLALRYGEVGCPALIVTGAEDPDMSDPAAEARRVAADLVAAPATVAMIEESGHYPHLDRPEETAKAVLAFLTGG